MPWVSQLCPVLADQVIAIDGSRSRKERAIHLVAAYARGPAMT